LALSRRPSIESRLFAAVMSSSPCDSSWRAYSGKFRAATA
jgi:hypothetical protein